MLSKKHEMWKKTYGFSITKMVHSSAVDFLREKSHDCGSSSFRGLLYLAPVDFFLFQKLKIKSPLKGQRFTTIFEVNENSEMVLRVIPETAFQDYFRNSKHRWEKCINQGGEYFEGGKS